MHVFPQLRELERRYPAELAVVGIHSAKFPAEKETANVRKAVLRYEIEHPVVNDADFRIWQEYGCRAWPTLMFLDPEGRVVGKLLGNQQGPAARVDEGVCGSFGPHGGQISAGDQVAMVGQRSGGHRHGQPQR